MPARTGGGYSALRLRKYRELLWNTKVPPTRNERERMFKNILKINETCTADEIFAAFKDDVKFWGYLVAVPVAFDALIDNLNWDQKLYVMKRHRKLIIGPTSYVAQREKSYAAISFNDDWVPEIYNGLYCMMLTLKDFDVLKWIIDRLMSPSKMAVFFGCTCNVLNKFLLTLNDASWWQNDELKKYVLFFHEFHEKTPELDYSTFYLLDQEPLFKLRESLVLLRGNQESREMGKCILRFFDLKSKAALIELENSIQMRHELQDAFFRTLFEGIQSTTLNLVIRRDHIVRDTLAQIETKKAYELRRQLKIRFEGEEGIDEGGLKKEFFQLLIKSCFNPEYGLFRYQEESRLHWFYPTSDDKMNHEAAEDCYSIGKLFGLAIYNSVQLEVEFPQALYKMLADKPVDIDDLVELEPSLGKGLKKILSMDEDEFEEAGLAGTPFEIDIPSGSMQSGKPLKFRLPSTHEGLTYENREQFIQLYAEAILHRTIELPLQAFIRGFKFTFGKSILFQFHPREIEGLLCGSKSFNIYELREGTTYEGGFTDESPIIEWFWQIMYTEFKEDERSKFLAFVSGTDRAPIGGLKDINLKIVKNGDDDDRLPTSHTCFNTLLLNNYSTKDKLRQWLKMAIENNTGFGLQ